MPLNIEQLDDEVILDKCPNFNGGVNSFSPASSIAPNELARLVNADISVEGRIITRRGSEHATTAALDWSHEVQAIAFYKTDAAVTYTANLCIIVRDATANAHFYVWNGAAWVDPNGGTKDFFPIVPAIMIQGNEILWIAQAGHSLQKFTGTTVVTAGGSPPTTPSLICWHTGRLIAAGIPGNPEGLSMSKFLDGETWDHANWDIGIGDGDGDPIVGIVPWTNFNLAVLKQHSVWVINCNPSLAAPATGNIAGFPVTNVHRQIGCVAGRSGVQVGADVFFLSDSGVRGVARILASEQQNVVGPPLSEPITDIINRINVAAYDTIVGYNWKNRYILSVPLDNATQPDHLLVWNTLTNSWSGYWTGWRATCFTRRVHSSIPKLCFGQADGSVVDFLDFVDESVEVAATYQDQNKANPTGIDYPTEIISRAFTVGDDDALKTGLFTKQEFNRSTATVDVSVILNSSDEAVLLDSFGTDVSTISLPIDLPFELLGGAGILPKSFDLLRFGQWRHLQIKLAATLGKISLNRLGIGAFMDTYVLQE